MVGLYVRYDDAEQVIVNAGHVVTFLDLPQMQDFLFKFVEVLLSVLLEGNVAVSYQMVSELFPVGNDGVLLDVPFLFQPFDPLINRRGGHSQPPGNLFIGQLGVLLQKSKDAAVGGI